MNIGVLCSGGLGFKQLEYLHISQEIVFVFTDKNSYEIINYCDANNIPIFIGNPRNANKLEFIKEKNVEILFSINYLFLINSSLISHPSRYSINIHGSLLPKYRGRTPHVWAIINNEIETGITAHLIDEGCDTGPIIEQIVIPINVDDTGADILIKYENNYSKLIDAILLKLNDSADISTIQQDENKATFYGRRTPDDGRINWDWQKERIRNWVRAQAHPYPGAFTYYNDDKIIIDKIIYSEIGFNADVQNGTILLTAPLAIKTPNGAIEITSMRPTDNLFEQGKIFN